jgi:hypothetical protein
MKQKNKLFKIAAPKIKLVTKGYINIIDKEHIEANKNGNPVIYKTKKSFLRQKTFENLKNNLSSKFNKFFAIASLLEAKVLIAKEMIKKAFINCEDSFIKANLFIQLAKANLKLKTFKYSIPKQVRLNLF